MAVSIAENFKNLTLFLRYPTACLEEMIKRKTIKRVRTLVLTRLCMVNPKLRKKAPYLRTWREMQQRLPEREDSPSSLVGSQLLTNLQIAP